MAKTAAAVDDGELLLALAPPPPDTSPSKLQAFFGRPATPVATHCSLVQTAVLAEGRTTPIRSRGRRGRKNSCGGQYFACVDNGDHDSALQNDSDDSRDVAAAAPPLMQTPSKAAGAPPRRGRRALVLVACAAAAALVGRRWLAWRRPGQGAVSLCAQSLLARGSCSRVESRQQTEVLLTVSGVRMRRSG